MPGEDTSVVLTASTSTDGGARAADSSQVISVPQGQVEKVTVTSGVPGDDNSSATATVNKDGSGSVETRAETYQDNGLRESVSVSRTSWDGTGETTQDYTRVDTYDENGDVANSVATSLDPETGVTTQTETVMARDANGEQFVQSSTTRTRSAETPEGQWDG
jgi:hypothetical protein